MTAAGSLIHDIENVVPYQLLENAAQADWPGGDGPALGLLAQFLPFDAHATYWQWLCPQAKRQQDGVALGRLAVRYSCVPTYVTGNADSIWVDKGFGIALAPLLPQRQIERRPSR